VGRGNGQRELVEWGQKPTRGDASKKATRNISDMKMKGRTGGVNDENEL